VYTQFTNTAVESLIESEVPQVGGFLFRATIELYCRPVRVRTTSYSTGTGLCLELTRAGVRHAKSHSLNLVSRLKTGATLHSPICLWHTDIFTPEARTFAYIRH